MTTRFDIPSRTSDTPSSDPQFDETAELSPDDIFHVLQTNRRREAIRYLLDEDELTKMRDVAEHVAAKEHETTVAQLTSAQRQQRLHSAVSVTSSETRQEGNHRVRPAPRVVRPTDRLEIFRPYLEASDNELERPRTDADRSATARVESAYFRTAIVASSSLLLISAMGVLSIPGSVLGAIIMILFIASHGRLERRRRTALDAIRELTVDPNSISWLPATGAQRFYAATPLSSVPVMLAWPDETIYEGIASVARPTRSGGPWSSTKQCGVTTTCSRRVAHSPAGSPIWACPGRRRRGLAGKPPRVDRLSARDLVAGRGDGRGQHPLPNPRTRVHARGFGRERPRHRGRTARTGLPRNARDGRSRSSRAVARGLRSRFDSHPRGGRKPRAVGRPAGAASLRRRPEDRPSAGSGRSRASERSRGPGSDLLHERDDE